MDLSSYPSFGKNSINPWVPNCSTVRPIILKQVDRLRGSIKYLKICCVRAKYTVATYAALYISRILSLHGIPKTIVSDRGPQFVSKFWEELHKSLGTKLLHSSAYHPQTSGQTERVNQILEDMLRACVSSPNQWTD